MPSTYRLVDPKAEMAVKVLDAFVYEPDGWTWHQETHPNPTWEQIEASIRRLDKFRYPFLHLRLRESEDTCGQRFEIMGGPGAYWFAGSLNGYFQRRYVDPEGGRGEIGIWSSDQGFADEERYICKDVETVIRAARHFVEHGDFDPSISWEQRTV